MNVLIWHVHGSWTTSFVQGAHRYLLPVLPGRGPFGRGRAQTWDWPASAVEVTPEQLGDEAVDVVVVQRVAELALCDKWLGQRTKPAMIWLEHNTPQGPINDMRHPVAGLEGVIVVHVSRFNALLWDIGNNPARVIEHGMADPGYAYRGDMAHAAVVVNEAARRGRVTGTDLYEHFAAQVPLDLFGMGNDTLAPTAGLTVVGNLRQNDLHREVARRSVYLHPYRWTSMGLALIEAMLLGMPIAAFATTEAPRHLSDATGVCSADLGEVTAGLRRLVEDRDAARRSGLAARAVALDRFSLDRFLSEWDDALVAAT